MSPCLLLAIKFHDELFVDRAVDVVPGRQCDHSRAHVRGVGTNPRGPATTRGSLPRAFNVGVLARRFFNRDNVAHFDLIRGNVDLAPVDQDVSVIDQLARLPARGGEAGAISSVVQAPLQKEQKVLTSDPLLSRSALEVVAKLTFENEVDPFNFLLFAQLLTVADHGLAAPQRITMLPGRLCAALFNRTRRLVTTIAFEKKLCTFTAAQTAHRISIPSQLICLQSYYQTEKFTSSNAAALHPLGHSPTLISKP